jgi:hypothetical protein
MGNHHTLTKNVDHGELATELATAGVTAGISIDHQKIYCSGPIWDAMDAAARTAELALIASTEASHSPTTITEVTLNTAPHIQALLDELVAVAGVTNVSVGLPTAYPGTAVIYHNSLTAGEQTNLSTAATSHDASSIPSLSVNTASQVIAADNVDTGTVTVTDSRGAAAAGKTVRLRIPAGGSAGADADSFVLDGAGQATVTFQATTVLTGDLTFAFYYANGEADEVEFTVRRGTA